MLHLMPESQHGFCVLGASLLQLASVLLSSGNSDEINTAILNTFFNQYFGAYAEMLNCCTLWVILDSV